ncbi:hypothetical protein [Legionella oakridgensis]|uniref:LTXXQ motif family protein n=3 Tax=Legionella oakridgensis TaxID=29423 RepID=W0BHF5_9GAMM|nr:hypothetical protein [Legionella oakridgensis]AHE68067.1 hypothetical protein Loa_02530 [Legionella oakridgensis ATCC 33761 = DSM 21215]ETO92415.1 hypothetical protein LOR_39c04560 [Legionella oakridgensis RV-2-2007]KTD44538.1 hypothetical protein Loak_0049 [Legionella oakridgensis]STY21051.1 Uncharacterised protein [Legionella longbeachae]
MNMKQLVITSTLALSLLSTSLAFANPSANNPGAPTKHHHPCHCHKKAGNMLNQQQRQTLHTIQQNSRSQIAPLLQEKRMLRLQLIGRLATPNTQWNDIAPLIKRINENNAKITELDAKTQLKTFQEIGVLLPAYGQHIHHHSQSF